MWSSIFLVTSLVFLCDLTRLVTGDEGHQIRSVSPSDEIFCSFDDNICGFHRPEGNHYFWVRNRGSTPNRFTGPTCDRFDCRRGSYWYINSARKPSGSFAILESPVMQGTGTPHCLSFQYHMFGVGMGFLVVTLRFINPGPDAADNAQLWLIPPGDRGNKWHEQRYDLSMSGNYKVIFEGVYGHSNTSDLAIDSVRIIRESCSVYYAEYEWKCNFNENENCGVVFNPLVNGLYWNRTYLSAPIQGCFPFDCPSVSYLYIDSSAHPRRSVASFKTPTLAGGGPTCVIMSINMNGRCRLIVDIWNHLNDERIRRWRIRGNSGSTWIIKTIQFTSTWRYRMEVRAMILRRGGSEFAISFMRVKEGTCQIYRSSLPNEIDCTFDNNRCGFTQSLDDDANWKWQRFSTPTPGTGPRCHDMSHHTDIHLTNNCTGRYFYVNARRLRRRKENGTAKMESPALNGGARACITFSYHMFGEGMGSLYVYAKDLIKGGLNHLWTIGHNQGNIWKYASFEFLSPLKYQIVFEARIGSSDQSDIAIDSFHIWNETNRCSFAELCNVQTLCLNGGTCYIASGLNHQYCLCQPAFNGARCENMNAIDVF